MRVAAVRVAAVGAAAVRAAAVRAAAVGVDLTAAGLPRTPWSSYRQVQSLRSTTLSSSSDLT